MSYLPLRGDWREQVRLPQRLVDRYKVSRRLLFVRWQEGSEGRGREQVGVTHDLMTDTTLVSLFVL